MSSYILLKNLSFVIVPTFYKENSGLVEKENVNMAEKMRNFKDQKV
ncbi:hypothetical protein LEP1GSC041_4261 [Leptospira noguchii str. 2006001870]|nr:hypothetical protein LEP1GSC041_4261 [Leptospira noguchii str. 2006001870]